MVWESGKRSDLNSRISFAYSLCSLSWLIGYANCVLSRSLERLTAVGLETKSAPPPLPPCSPTSWWDNHRPVPELLVAPPGTSPRMRGWETTNCAITTICGGKYLLYEFVWPMTVTAVPYKFGIIFSCTTVAFSAKSTRFIKPGNYESSDQTK